MSNLVVIVKSIATVSGRDTGPAVVEDSMIDCVGDTEIAIAASHYSEEFPGILAARMTGASCLLSEPALRRTRHSAACLSGSRQFFNYQFRIPAPQTRSMTDLCGAGATTSGI